LLCRRVDTLRSLRESLHGLGEPTASNFVKAGAAVTFMVAVTVGTRTMAGCGRRAQHSIFLIGIPGADPFPNAHKECFPVLEYYSRPENEKFGFI